MDAEQRQDILSEIRSMHYGSSMSMPAWDVAELFPPPPKPTLFEVVVDISRSLHEKRDEFVSSLPPEDGPQNCLEVLQEELGDEYRVTKYRGNYVRIDRLLAKCPKCKGLGFFLSHPKVFVTPDITSEVPIESCYEVSRQTCDHTPLNNND
ncbi:hypothetical protein D0962_23270 [Leptolyngbyaceae cyanobacterium CCMR0082]|uniref:Uncharacterized protein n=1 Tax=Adonisia turfae CCMR0082 TaxID=2304604 RepID=A0A6M0SCC9_9CYAN|nr:hypothetical protein [Adonisia turfae]NEZ65641.1 hypothetical protein [Adonisia turfae CCMR0082]